MESKTTKKDNSLKVFHAESATTGVENAGASYQAASLIASGANAPTVGLLSAVINLVSSLLYMKIPGVIDRVGSRKKTVIFLMILDAFTWLPLIVVYFFFPNINPYWLIVLWVFNLVPAIMAAPIRDNWVVDIIPAQSMGKYLGVRSAISNIAYLILFFIMGRALDLFKDSVSTGFTLVFIISMGGALSCCALYFMAKDPVDTTKNAVKLSIKQFINETKHQSIGKFILFCAVIWFAVQISAPFLSVYILTDLNLSYTVYTSLFLASYLARIVSVTLWGRYSDKFGNFKIISIVAPLIIVYQFLMLTTSNVVALFFIQLFSGVMWAGFDLCSYNLIYKAAPIEKRLQYSIYQRAIMTFAMALGALGGMGLINIVPAIGGYNVLSLFLISGVIGFAAMAVIFPALKNIEVVVRPARVRSLEEQELSFPVLNGFRQGLYNSSPREWARFKAASRKAQYAPVVNTAERGMLHRPQVWNLFSSPTGIPQPIIASAKLAEAAPARPARYDRVKHQAQSATRSAMRKNTEVKEEDLPSKGLLGRPEIWTRYNNKADSKSVASLKKNVKTGEGLYHNPDAWRRKGANTTPLTARSYNKMVSQDMGIYHKPEEWNNFTRRYASAEYTRSFSSSDQISPSPALFKRPQDWERYYSHDGAFRQTIRGDARYDISSRPALFHNPQEWNRYESKRKTSNESNGLHKHSKLQPKLNLI